MARPIVGAGFLYVIAPLALVLGYEKIEPVAEAGQVLVD
jgi:hypothetical protein